MYDAIPELMLAMSGRHPRLPKGIGKLDRIASIENRSSAGIGVLLLSQLVLLFFDTSVKWMTNQGIPTGEIVFIRCFVHVGLVLCIIWPLRGSVLFRTGNFWLEVARGLCMLATVDCRLELTRGCH